MSVNKEIAGLGFQLSLNEQRFIGGVNRVKGSITGLNKVGLDLMRSFGIGFGAYQFAGAMKFAVGVMADFEAEMSKVKAITKGIGFDQLEKSAIQLGGSTRYTATEVAGLQFEYAKLGFTTKEILSVSEATLHLATAAGTDLANAAAIVGITIRAFGMEASEAARVTDVMAASFTNSALDITKFQESMKYVAPIAKSANISIEETTAMLMALADAGISGSMAGTSMRRILSEMEISGKPTAARLRELAAGGLDLAGSFDEVGRIAMTSLLVLSDNTDKIQEYTSVLNEAEGETKKMAETMANNLTGSTIKFSSALEGLILQMKGSTGVMKEVVDFGTDFLQVFSNENLSGFEKYLVALNPLHLLPFRDAIKETEKAQKELNEANKIAHDQLIERQVQVALASGNVEAYIDALKRNINAEEIISRIRAEQKKAADEDLKVKIELLNQQMAEIKTIETLEAKIKELESTKKTIPAANKALLESNQKLIDQYRDEVWLLQNANTQFEKRLQLIRAQGQLSNMSPTGAMPTLGQGGATPGDALGRAIASDAPFIAQAQAAAKAAAEIEGLMIMGEGYKHQLMETQQMAAQMGNAVGQAFGQAAQGQITYGQAIKRSTGEIINALMLQALAIAIRTEAIKGIVGIATATIAVTAFGAMFRSLGARGSGVSGGGGSTSLGNSFSRTSDFRNVNQTPVNITGNFRVQGKDLVAVIDKANYSNSKTG